MQTVVDGLENSSLNKTTQQENFMKNARRFSSRETLDQQINIFWHISKLN